MNYKKEIDKLRRERVRIQFNLKQINYDIEQLPPDLGALFDEFHKESKRLREIDDLIISLQPLWRRLLGVLY